ncbi:hypothetical protein M514_05210 [Trichuris suis]|uniref:Uncharacterized protein n=1 Tax=Trichuris suis TaxID=68888 RepID=A0A085MU71_9BILA|nr:hypothetical protein M514_05210 [Trichuris suis]
MAANVSVEEFSRLQQQFLDVRKEYYELLEAASRKDSELERCRKCIAKLENELEAKNSSSSFEQSIDYLQRENELLRERLYLQEQEFQLQQATIHSEVLKLLSQNDDLRMLVSSLSKSASPDRQDSQGAEPVGVIVSRGGDEDAGMLCNPNRGGQRYELDTQGATNSTAHGIDVNETMEPIEARHELHDLRTVNHNDSLNSEVTRLQEECQVMKLDLLSDVPFEGKSLVSLVFVPFSCVLSCFLCQRGLPSSILLCPVNSCILWCVILSISSFQKARNRECDLVASLGNKNSQLESLHRNSDEPTATSNKRKELLDDMTQCIDEIKSKSEGARCELEESSSAQIRALREEVESLTARLAECKASRASLESMQKELNYANVKLRELSLLVEQCEQEKERLQSQAEKAVMESRKALTTEIELAKSECADWKKKCGECQKRLTSTEASHRVAIDELKKDYDDKLDQAKASLHRQYSVIQDLRKQFHCETKRSERLQEKLGELLKDVHGYTKREDFGEMNSRLRGDSGSNSSWSLVSGIKGEFDKISFTCSDQESVSSVTVLEGEIQELVDRVATLKQKNSDLTEKVQILEDSSSKMAEDLLSKNSLIERLLRDRRSIFDGSRLNLKGMVEKVRLELFENDARTMNKKLQRLLEETLTKNVYLQKNIETLSQEVLKLSGGCSAQQAGSCQETRR